MISDYLSGQVVRVLALTAGGCGFKLPGTKYNLLPAVLHNKVK